MNQNFAGRESALSARSCLHDVRYKVIPVQAMKAYGVKVHFHAFITSTLVYRSYYGIIKKGKSVPYSPEVPRGFQEVKVPRLRDGGKVVSLTHRPLLPSGITPGTFR